MPLNTGIVADRPAARQPLSGLSAAVLIAATVGIILIWMAAPHLMSSIYTPTQEYRLTLADSGDRRAILALNTLERDLQTALAIRETGRNWSRLGAVRLALAMAAGPQSDNGRGHLDDSIDALGRGLSLAPHQPYSWTQLLQASLLRHGLSDESGRLLKMAILTGPSEPALVLARVDIGLYAWRRLDEETREVLAGQIRLAGMRDLKALLDLTRRRHALSQVRAALQPDATLQRRFDDAYRLGPPAG